MYDAGADLCLIKPLQFEHFRLEVIRLLNEAVGSAQSCPGDRIPALGGG